MQTSALSGSCVCVRQFTSPISQDKDLPLSSMKGEVTRALERKINKEPLIEEATCVSLSIGVNRPGPISADWTGSGSLRPPSITS